VVALGLFVMAGYLDLGERWHAWSMAHEDWELDELLIALGLSSGAFVWYSYRRWREARREALHRIQINRELAQEVAAHQETESSLRESEGRLRQASQLAKIGYYVWDAVEDRCLFCSEEHARTHGLSPSEYIARASALDGAFPLTHPDDREAVRESLKALRGGRAVEMEYRTVTPGGEVRYVRELAKPIFDASGSVVQEIGSSQDVTETKLAEQRLRQAQKMEAVGQLTGGVAHDFNNLLAVVQGNAELLGDRLGPEDRSLQAIQRASTRGAELTQRLLAFSRQQPLRPRAIDMAALVSGMSDLLTRSLGETVEIETASEPGLWDALADPGQVENALLNLALNARDAMPGGGKLTIEYGNIRLDDAYVAGIREAKAGDYVVLAVSDTGSGMTAEVQAHAFEPFFTTKEVGRGSGLGLSMVYGFAKQSGGHVTIYSEQGRGTAVKLYLPRAEAAARREDARRSEDVPRGRGETILVVEDDSDVRALAVAMLEGLDYRTIDVGDAAAAREALADGQAVDLVLSDVVLPGGISGPEFAEQACTTHPDLKIIFMSGYPAEAARRNGVLGSDKVLLNKPFQRRQIARALREALD
jgi:PAS domain S-box-containing protein